MLLAFLPVLLLPRGMHSSWVFVSGSFSCHAMLTSDATSGLVCVPANLCLWLVH